MRVGWVRPVLLLLLSVVVPAFAWGETPGVAAESAPYVQGEVIVRFEDGAGPVEAGLGPARVVAGAAAGGFTTVVAPAGGEAAFAAAMSEAPGVAYAELNYLKQPSFVPNDADYGRQWNFRLIGAESAWEKSDGSGVTIAVLDTGVAFEEFGIYGKSPELENAEFRDPYATGFGSTQPSAHPVDHSGHGTHVVGTLVQDTNNGTGTAGLAPGATIIPVKVCHPPGCSSDAIAAGVHWAIDHGADIINMSFGGSAISNVEREAFAAAEAAEILVVAAAGNGGGDFVGDADLDYPAAIETVVAVGAVDLQRNRTNYSNYGSGEGDGLHVMAPGGNTRVDLNSDGFKDGILQNTYAFACQGGAPNYKAFDECMNLGTSMATPHVSGVAALILSKFPDLTPEKLRTVLGCSAMDLGAIGEDEEYGSGLVQADAALEDEDGDGRPDCLDGAAQVHFEATPVKVIPGGRVEVPVSGFVDGDPIGSYSVVVGFNKDALAAVSCEPQAGGTCEAGEGSVTFANAFASGQGGGFRAGWVVFEATTDPGFSSAYLLFEGEAQELLSKDPTPVVTMTPSLIQIVAVPDTLPGDSNCDGHFDGQDVVLALGFMAEFYPGFCAVFADVNCSGLVDLFDVLQMLHYLAEIDPTVTSGCPLPETPTPSPPVVPSETPGVTDTPTVTASPG